MRQRVGHRLDRYLEKKLTDIKTRIAGLEESVAQNRDILKALRDGVVQLRKELLEVRGSEEYSRVWEEENPLVSVRIATYNRGELLVTRSLRSVLEQTYQNFEVIVVGDHCTDGTEQLIEELRDPRIRFYNLPHRSVYPDDPELKWMVAGAPGMNLATSLARGSWIAPLDDDDEFSPDHIEKLLGLAIESRSELAYGRLKRLESDTGRSLDIWAFPPQHGLFSFQAAIYLRLLRFFELDEESWVVREPADWNLCRRMLEAGVRMTATQDIVGILYWNPIEQRA